MLLEMLTLRFLARPKAPVRSELNVSVAFRDIVQIDFIVIGRLIFGTPNALEDELTLARKI